MVRTVLSPINYGDIRLQYIRVVVSFPMCGEEDEISHSPTSQLEFEPRSKGCANYAVKSACVFCS